MLGATNLREVTRYMAKSKRFGVKKPFDPEGSGYDYHRARKAGIKRDATGHYQSRDPKTGQILKGRGHATFHKTVKGEKEAGYEIYKKSNGRYYSRKKRK